MWTLCWWVVVSLLWLIDSPHIHPWQGLSNKQLLVSTSALLSFICQRPWLRGLLNAPQDSLRKSAFAPMGPRAQVTVCPYVCLLYSDQSSPHCLHASMSNQVLHGLRTRPGGVTVKKRRQLSTAEWPALFTDHFKLFYRHFSRISNASKFQLII